jgi:hypothetical protein
MDKFEKILINVAYDDLTKPNLSNLDIHPNWLLDTKNDMRRYLFWTQFEKYWGNKLQTFQTNTIDNFHQKNLKYIYPITLYSSDLFKNYHSIELNNLLVKDIKNKKAKIVFLYVTEGDWGIYKFHFDWLDNLIEKYKFDNDDVYMVSANLKANENYTKNKFTIIPYNFFINRLDFLSIDKLDKYRLKQFENEYVKYINNNKINKKKKHFVCFNGIPKLHRLLMFGMIKSNPILNNTTILSLRNSKSNNSKSFYEEVLNNSVHETIIDFFKTYDSNINYSYDTQDWDSLYDWGNFINEKAHNSTFVNIVTETMCNNESIFLTEKIYKPIYMCQPFIIFGNPNSLTKLKEYGFKTFDKWWDESYDTELDFNSRFEKITKVLQEIASWDFDKCHQMTIQMEEIFIHNYKQLLTTDELYRIYSLLQTDSKFTKTSVI